MDEDKPIEVEVRKAALIIGLREGLNSVKKLKANPKKDKMPSNPTQIVSLYAMHIESILGGLLLDYVKKARNEKAEIILPQGITVDEANLAIR